MDLFQMKVLKEGDIVLKKTCQDVLFGQEELEPVLAEMRQVFSKYPRSQGLSASQLGILKKIAVMRDKGREFFVINPKIEVSLGGCRMSVESCLSTDQYQDQHDYYQVKRPRWVVVSYYDENGKKYRKLINSKVTRVFCHEIDHMYGRLITDEGRFYRSCRIVSSCRDWGGTDAGAD